MNKIISSSIQLLQQIASDMMLFATLFAPILVGLLIKFVVPLAGDVLLPYYPIFDLFLSIIVPVMFCFAATMIILEEIDDKVSRYFIVTPLGKGGYMVSRLGVPALLSIIVTPIILTLFSLTQMKFNMILALALLSSLQAIVISLLIVSLSKNKLEGMAITKLASLFLLGIPAPFFISGWAQYFVSILPSFWMAKAVQGDTLFPLLIAFFVSVIWILLLLRKFCEKVSV